MVKNDVKLGFIVEGETEKIILEQSDFFRYLKSKKIDFIPDVIDAGGCKNLLPHNIIRYEQALFNKGASKIIILTDMDSDSCITQTKERIIGGNTSFKHSISISNKEIESWFLADTQAMRSYICDEHFYSNTPEAIIDPYGEIKRLKVSACNRGCGSKLVMARTIIKDHGFSIERAAKHSNCNSAKYFLGVIGKYIK